MEQIGVILDRVVVKCMAQIKVDCLSKPFTTERSVIVDQIDFVETAMQRDGLSFHEAVRRLQ